MMNPNATELDSDSEYRISLALLAAGGLGYLSRRRQGARAGDGDDFDLELDHADLINGASGLGIEQTIARYRGWADEILTTFGKHPVPRTLMS